MSPIRFVNKNTIFLKKKFKKKRKESSKGDWATPSHPWNDGHPRPLKEAARHPQTTLGWRRVWGGARPPPVAWGWPKRPPLEDPGVAIGPPPVAGGGQATAKGWPSHPFQLFFIIILFFSFLLFF